MFLPFFSHPFANRIADMQHVGFDVAKLFIPRIGPMPALVSGQP
jgi:hypothetical protein